MEMHKLCHKSNSGVVGTQIVHTYLNTIYKQNHLQETWILETKPASNVSLKH